MNKLNEQKQKMMRYVKGWMTSAGCCSIPPELRNDEDFLRGWTDGHIAKRAAKDQAEVKYGVKFGKIVLANSQPNERPG